MHALELLLDEHEYVVKLFDRVRRGRNGTSLFAQIKSAIELHKHIEEKCFYPLLIDEGDEELRVVVESAIDDHQQVKTFLDELDTVASDDERFPPKLNLMMEDVERYIEIEEEKMFPLAEQQFDDETLERIGSEMEAEKARLQGEDANV